MKELLRFIPIKLTLFLVLGILFGSLYDFRPNKIVVLLVVLQLLFIIVFIISNKQFTPISLFGILVLTLPFFIGAGSVTFNNQLHKNRHYSNNPAFETDKPISCVISIQKIVKPDSHYYKYEATIIQLNHDKTIGKILVNIEKNSVDKYLNVDDELLVKTVFKEIKNPLNPYSFDYKKYLQNQQIYHQIYVANKHYLKIFQSKRTLKGIASRIREKINKSLKKDGFDNNELAIINALLLGQRQTINSELQQSYADAGVVHILAVSGLHVGIILLLLTFLLKPLHLFKNGKLIASILIIIILWMYAIIAGLSASVVRAVSMFTAVAIGMFLNRPSNVYNTLTISMFFLLLFNPYYLFEVGFQLSYIAVFSIVWIQPKLNVLWKPKFWLLNKIWQLFTISIAAQIGVLPLSLYYFHQFPGLFFLSNLVIIPFLGVLLVAGFLVIAFSVFELLPQYFGNSYSLIIQNLNYFVAWVSNQESFIIQNIAFSIAMMLSFYAFIVLFFKWVEKKVFYRLVLLLFSLITIQSVGIFEKFKRESTKEFIVFNESKGSIIGIRNGNELHISTSSDSLDINEIIIKSYVIGSGINDAVKTLTHKNLFLFNKEMILVVDSLGIYKFKSLKPSMVLLQNSPKINLERLLDYLHPKLIIADGSNYKSFVEKWRQTCLKNKTPFYSTMQKGAFMMDK